MDPLSDDINKAFSLVLKEEKQKEIGTTISTTYGSQVAFAFKASNSDQSKPKTKKERPQRLFG